MHGEAAAWICALGLERGARGGFVRTYHAVEAEGAARLIEVNYVLLSSAAPRIQICGDAAQRLYFHHAGGVVRVQCDERQAPVGPGAYQVEVAGALALELATGSYALLSEAVVPAESSGQPRPVPTASMEAGPEDEGARWIERLGLRAHVEGGYFTERWRAARSVELARGRRALASTIYYLLTFDSPVGRFHRNVSGITHLFHAGGPIVYTMIDPAGGWHEVVLGADPAAGQVPAFTCPGGWWKSSHLPAGARAGLISEIVAPGFDWADQSMADAALFERLFPQHRARWAGLVDP